jgi:glycine/sarcosine N-methyltransferase
VAEQVRRFYDELAANYHLIFEDWDASISRQAAALGPILERECSAGSLRILDCTCGIGTQTLGLAGFGHKVTACDLSSAAVKRMSLEASERGLHVQEYVADLLDLTAIPVGNFDAVVCMDNSLPHLDGEDQLVQAATQIRRKLRPGGLFIASIRDYDALVRERPAVQGPAFYVDAGRRRIVHQVWDWIDDRRYTFHLYITRETSDGWESQHYASSYRALLRDEMTNILEIAGFVGSHWLFSAEGGFYQPIVLARTPTADL